MKPVRFRSSHGLTWPLLLLGVLAPALPVIAQTVRLDSPRAFLWRDGTAFPSCGDFDEDGHVDILYGGAGRREFEILFGDGTGEFAATQFPTAYNPDVSVVGDFDGDGHLDAAFGHSRNSKNDLSIHLGDGHGGFSAAVNVVGPQDVASLVTGDWNEDGALDLAAVDPTTHRIWIHIGDGAGGFSPGIDVPTGLAPNATAVGDFNNDDHLDLAVAAYDGDVVSLLLGDGNGGFAVAAPLPAPSARFVTAADLDRDGNLDLMVATYELSTVRLLFGSGDGTFDEPVAALITDPGAFTTWVTVGDYDADGHLDLAAAAAKEPEDAIHVFRGDGQRGFTRSQRKALANWPVALLAADFDENGLLDLAAARRINRAIVVLLDAGSATFESAARFPLDRPYAIASADFNGDGLPDVAATEVNADQVAVFVNDGAGGMTASGSILIGGFPLDIAVGDFNEDDNVDIVACNLHSDKLSVLLGDGTGGFALSGTFTTLDRPESITVADINGDDHLDVLVTSDSVARVEIYTGDGSGSLALAAFKNTASLASAVVTADFNEDGNLDFAVTRYYLSDVAYYVGDGNGSFSLAGTFEVGNPLSLHAVDLDVDGHVDLVCADAINRRLHIAYGDGAGGFVHAQYETDDGVKAIASADLDENGYLELILGNFSASVVTIVPNLGGRNYGTQLHFASGSFPISLAPADYDDDGYVDVAVAFGYFGDPGGLAILTNEIARERPAFLTPPPCGLEARVPAFVPLRVAIAAESRTDHPHDAATLDLVGNGLPPGVAIEPALPTPPGQPTQVVIDWTPSSGDLGPYTAKFVATGVYGKRALCEIGFEVVSQTHLLLASRTGGDSFDAGVGGHVFPTSLASVWRADTVSPGETPALLESEIQYTLATDARLGSPGRGALAETAPHVFTVQALSFDPVHDPGNPERYSRAIEVTRQRDGSITTREIGPSDGMQLSVEIAVDKSGRRTFRFPFTIDSP